MGDSSATEVRAASDPDGTDASPPELGNIGRPSNGAPPIGFAGDEAGADPASRGGAPAGAASPGRDAAAAWTSMLNGRSGARRDGGALEPAGVDCPSAGAEDFRPEFPFDAGACFIQPRPCVPAPGSSVAPSRNGTRRPEVDAATRSKTSEKATFPPADPLAAAVPEPVSIGIAVEVTARLLIAGLP